MPIYLQHSVGTQRRNHPEDWDPITGGRWYNEKMMHKRLCPMTAPGLKKEEMFRVQGDYQVHQRSPF